MDRGAVESSRARPSASKAPRTPLPRRELEVSQLRDLGHPEAGPGPVNGAAHRYGSVFSRAPM
eukprot:9674742-Alexandrium_andersonii.AAC.1